MFIVFMIFRVGGPSGASHVFGWGIGDVDTGIFGTLTSVGYFYIIIILLIGIAMGDNNKFTVKCHYQLSYKNHRSLIFSCCCLISLGSFSLLRLEQSKSEYGENIHTTSRADK